MRRTAAVTTALLLVVACGDTSVTLPGPDPPTATAQVTLGDLVVPTSRPADRAAFRVGLIDGGIAIDKGGDVDHQVVRAAADSALSAVRSGNGRDLTGDGTPDAYLQFRVTDDLIHEGQPTTRLRIEVEYLDRGTDTFNVQYDALAGGPLGDGRFKEGPFVTKGDTGTYQIAVFHLCDAYFGNRDHGADFRIADHAPNGAETIQSVTVTRSASTTPVISVDSCGANPFDGEPDSEAIQACIDQTCDGDTVLFRSAAGDPGYQGYIVDETIFLTRTGAKSDLTFTSTDPGDHALLTAHPSLAGFVVRLYARSAIGAAAGDIDDIAVSHLDIDGNRAQRACFGNDGKEDGNEDNWGSWLPECTAANDSWCRPGGLAMLGRVDTQDPAQDYTGHPERWSTGLVVHDVTVSNTECGTGLAYAGAAGSIDSVTIDTAGDHVHRMSCAQTDADEPRGGWADGITIRGPANAVTNNDVRDASDIGIVSFGGRDTLITGNTVTASPGNHGMFAGIAVHPWAFGLLSGFTVTDNTVVSDAHAPCGGIHAGINIGPHMWNAGCKNGGPPASFGNVGACTATSGPPGESSCQADMPCRVWGYIPSGSTFTLAGNSATGAQINYLTGGIDVQGVFDEHDNASVTPQQSDWQSAAACTMDGVTETWTTHHYVAHDPPLPGWDDKPIYCER